MIKCNKKNTRKEGVAFVIPAVCVTVLVGVGRESSCVCIRVYLSVCLSVYLGCIPVCFTVRLHGVFLWVVCLSVCLCVFFSWCCLFVCFSLILSLCVHLSGLSVFQSDLFSLCLFLSLCLSHCHCLCLCMCDGLAASPRHPPTPRPPPPPPPHSLSILCMPV